MLVLQNRSFSSTYFESLTRSAPEILSCHGEVVVCHDSSPVAICDLLAAGMTVNLCMNKLSV